jgi:multiple sugar transport system substrate-binding protein
LNRAGWTRRRVLASAAGGVALAAAGAFPMPAIAQSKKLTYWGGLVLSDTAHKLLIDAVTAWGAANNVETEAS